MPEPNRDSASSGERAQPFLYSPPAQDLSLVRAEGAAPGGSGVPGSEARLAAEEFRKEYERGVADGQSRARTEHSNALSEVREQIAAALKEFSGDREDYFMRIEAEVVRLSLSIARKILHRESQIDPLVLTGVVHVALQKLNSDTTVRLRANPDEIRFWNDYFKHSKEMFHNIEVAGDSSLKRGECRLETDFGTTEISLETQLKEIEQGFFDLLEQRTREKE